MPRLEIQSLSSRCVNGVDIQYKPAHHPSKVCPVRVVHQVVESARALAHSKVVRIHVSLAASPNSIIADPVALKQIMQTLVFNAIRFTLPGGHLTIEVFSTGAMCCFRVSDSGCGIRPEHLPHVFDKRRLHKSGLATVKRDVLLHGGQVMAESRGPEKGSEFTVLLPLDSDSRSTVVTLPAPYYDLRAPQTVAYQDVHLK